MSTPDYEVLFDFGAEDEGELSVRKGEKVKSETGTNEDGWIQVSNSDGVSGFVPIDYVKKIDLVTTATTAISAPAGINTASVPAVPTVSISVVPPLTTDMLSSQGASTLPTVPTARDNPYTPAPLSAPAASTATMTQSTPSLGSKLSLKSAAKSVTTVNRATQALAAKVLPPSKAPSLVLSAERGDVNELLRRNGEYVDRVVATQAETLDSVTDMVQAIATKLAEASKASNDFVSDLNALDKLVDEEKRRWKARTETERNSTLSERTSELTGQFVGSNHSLDSPRVSLLSSR